MAFLALPTSFAHAAVLVSALPGYLAWRRATRRPEETQWSVLRSILHRNADTAFGRAHGFARIHGPEEYQKAVPLSTYSDLEPYIQRMAGGERNVLTADPVLLFEPTSGSTSASKLIPYTKALKKEFQAGINPWLWSLCTQPSLLPAGKQYWSLTPVARDASYTSGGIPIGFEEDTEYFGPLRRRIVRALMAVPSETRHIRDLDAFRYTTLRFLIACRDLALISVWNPTFLMLLLDGLPRWGARIVRDVADGALTPPVPLGPNVQTALTAHIRPDRTRAREVECLLDAWGADPLCPDARGRTLYEAIWPNLRLISCWADASAADYAARLQSWFPTSASLHPKGLLATEAFVSFPTGGAGGAALALRSHFFEFLEEGAKDGQAPRLAHELELEKTYSVVVTTGGGLYRYRMQDRVRVQGFRGQCATVTFQGKEDAVADVFGEKLNEGHVLRVVSAALRDLGVVPAFWMLAPDTPGALSGHYTLYVQCSAPDGVLRSLAVAVDDALCENYHYRYCRDLGQLTPLHVFLIDSQAEEASQTFLKTASGMAQRLGDVKPAYLHAYRGWSSAFSGRYVGEG